jgi:hypothetical protein
MIGSPITRLIMKLYHYIRALAFTISGLPLFSYAQGLHIQAGAQWVVNGGPTLVLNNAGITNNGAFTGGSGTVLFTGGAVTGQSFVRGDQPVNFYNLVINKSSNDVQLNNNAAVSDSIVMERGNLELNNYTLDLGSTGRIVGERDTCRITGVEGGLVKVSAMLRSPGAVNPGNIGIEITSEADLGATLIQRGNVQQTNPNGSTSIQRYFDISPAANTDLPATLRFFYLDSELAGRTKGQLVVYSSRGDGGNWTQLGADAADQVRDWVAKANINQWRRFTLSIPEKSVFPANPDASIQLYPNPSHDQFIVAFNSEKEGDQVFSLYDQLGRLLEQRIVPAMAGANTISWDTGKYAAGVYYLSAGGPNGKTIKIVKQ